MRIERMVFGLVVLICLACSTPRQVVDALRADEIRLVAWLVEDLAHNLPRDTRALDTTQASPAQRRIALWLTGSEQGDGDLQPGPIRDRRARWPLMRPALESGRGAIAGDTLTVNLPDPEAQAVLRELVQQENASRQRGSDVLLALAGAEADSLLGRQLRAEIGRARAWHLERIKRP